MDDKLRETIEDVYCDVLFHADDEKRCEIIVNALYAYYENESKKCGYPAELLCMFDSKCFDNVTI